MRLTDFGLSFSAEDVRLAVLAFVACWLPVYAVNGLVSLAGWRAPEGKHPFFTILENDPSLVTLALLAFSVMVAAPLSEELTYRVVLQGWLERIVPPWLAVVVVAVVFSAAHYSPGRPDPLPLFPLAIILGVVYQRRRSLPAVVLLHALFNAANLAFAWAALA